MSRILLGTNLLIEQTKKDAFNLDTILLGSFIDVPLKSKIVMDFGTGAGGLMLYLSSKTKAKIIGVEIQEDRFKQALNNIKLNNLEDQVSVILEDINKLNYKNVDYIVSNPPFFKVDEKSILNNSDDITIARHEVMLKLEDLIKVASRSLKDNGYFVMIHRPERFTEILELLNKYQLEVKKIRFVHPYINSEANHVLISSSKNGKKGIKVLNPLIIYDSKHQLSKEMLEVYGGIKHVTKRTE
jgi:tRNA1(Val) A37 N6-methylase TrmN6